MTTRRELLGGAAAAFAFGKAAGGLKIGVMDGIVRLASKPESVTAVRQFGLKGMQVTLGRASDGGGAMPLENPEVQRAFVRAARDQGVELASTYIDMLHVSCLKNDQLAPSWVRKGIEITKRLDARILMTVFFGKCALEPKDYDTVAGAFRELAPEAQKAGVILGFENLISAEDNARVMDKVASPAFKIYYDAGNATNVGGFDAPKEIRFLGKDRICQFHFKDKGYLGEGKVDYKAVLAAVADIGYKGWAMLETSAPSGDSAADLKKNIEYLNKLMA